jgi:hypothetical protein
MAEKDVQTILGEAGAPAPGPMPLSGSRGGGYRYPVRPTRPTTLMIAMRVEVREVA